MLAQPEVQPDAIILFATAAQGQAAGMTIGSLRWLCWLPFVGAETALAGPLAAHEWSRNELGDGNASLVSHASLCRAGKCWPATWILGGQKCGSTSVWIWLKKKSTYGVCGAVIPPEAEAYHEKETHFWTPRHTKQMHYSVDHHVRLIPAWGRGWVNWIP